LALVQPNNLYRCLDKLTAHKQAMFTFLGERWTLTPMQRLEAADLLSNEPGHLIAAVQVAPTK
jgi:hypothetical protein